MSQCEDCGKDLLKIYLAHRGPYAITSRTEPTTVLVNEYGELDTHKAVCEECVRNYEEG